MLTQETKQQTQQNSALSFEFLKKLSAHYALPQPRSWYRAKSGHTGETWIVNLGRIKVVVRRYHPWFDQAWVEYEHSILRHLLQSHFPVPDIIRSAEGEFFWIHEGGYYTLFEYLEGDVLTHPFQRKIQPQDVKTAGRTLAHYHRLMENFQPDGREAMRGVDYRWCIKELSKYHETIARRNSLSKWDRYVLEHIEEAKGQLTNLGAFLDNHLTACSKIIIHGDYSPSHVLFRGGKIVGVLDFNNAHSDTRITDVARSLTTFSLWFGPRLDLALGRNFLEAYQEHFPLTETELDLLPSRMIFNRLRGLWWDLMQYYDKGQLNLAPRFAHNFELARWIKKHEAKMRKSWRLN